MLRTKQLGTISHCARSFFLTGSRSGASDGAACTTNDDEPCISKKPTNKSATSHPQVQASLLSKPAAFINGSVGGHRGETRANRGSVSQDLAASAASNSILRPETICFGGGDYHSSHNKLASPLVGDAENREKSGSATVGLVNNIEQSRHPTLDGGNLPHKSQNYVVSSNAFPGSRPQNGKPAKQTFPSAVTQRSSVEADRLCTTAKVNYEGSKSRVNKTNFSEDFHSAKPRFVKECGSSASNLENLRQCVPQTDRNKSGPPILHQNEQIHDKKGASSNRFAVNSSRVPRSARYRKDNASSGPSAKGNRILVDRVHQILVNFKWGPACEKALINVGPFDAFQANQVLKIIRDSTVAGKFFYWLKDQPGFKHDEHSYTTMIGILGKARQFVAARRLLVEMVGDGVHPNVVTYNRLIHGYGCANYLDEAMKIFHKMQKEGCEPDRVTYSTLIDIHAKAGFMDVAMDLYKHMLEVGLSLDTFTYSVMINCLGKAGHLADAHKLFSEMVSHGCVPNLVTYNIMITLYAKSRRYPNALKLYRDMQAAGHRPDRVTYSIVMEVLGHCGHLHEAEALYAEMKRDEMVPDQHVYGLLVDLWGKSGNVDKAQAWYGSMLDAGLMPNVPICNSLLSAFLRVQWFPEASDLLRNMLKMGLSPSLQTYTLLLSCCTESQYQNHMVFCCQLMAITDHPAHAFLAHMPPAGPDGQNVRDHVNGFLDLMHSEDRESKRGLVDAVIDFLHKSGLKEEASSVWEVAALKNVYPDAVREKSSCYWLINLHVMSDGTAVIALSRTLAGFRKKLLASGVGPSRIDIITGWGRRSRVTGSSMVRQSVQDLLNLFSFPFFPQNGNSGCFVGCGEPLNTWLLHPYVERMHLL